MELKLEVLAGSYGILRLGEAEAMPDWAEGPGVVSMTRAEGELSIVLRTERVPPGIACDAGWRMLKVVSLAELDEPGVVLAAVRPISQAGFGVFVISTYLRDYLLVRGDALMRITALLAEAGHQVEER